MITLTGTQFTELDNQLKSINQLREFPYLENLDEFVLFSPWFLGEDIYLPLYPKALASQNGANKTVKPVRLSTQKLQECGLSEAQIKTVHQYGGLCQYEGKWFVITKDGLTKLGAIVGGKNPVGRTILRNPHLRIYVDMLNMGLLGISDNDPIAQISYSTCDAKVGDITQFIGTGQKDEEEPNRFIDEYGKFRYAKILKQLLETLRAMYPKAHLIRWIQMDEYFFVYLALPELLEKNEFGPLTHLRPTLQITWSLDGKIAFQVSGALYSPTFEVGLPVTKQETFVANGKENENKFATRILRYSTGIYSLSQIMHKLLHQHTRGTHITEEHRLAQSGIPQKVGQKNYDTATKRVASALFPYQGKREKHPEWQMLLNQLTPLFYLVLHPDLSVTKEGVSSAKKNLAGVFPRIFSASQLWGDYLLDLRY